jgi:hypothetical protein
MMLPVGERERHEIVEDLLSKEEDKQHKNLPFMAPAILSTVVPNLDLRMLEKLHS